MAGDKYSIGVLSKKVCNAVIKYYILEIDFVFVFFVFFNKWSGFSHTILRERN